MCLLYTKCSLYRAKYSFWADIILRCCDQFYYPMGFINDYCFRVGDSVVLYAESNVSYLIVLKKELTIFGECVIPIPMSHFIDSKIEATRWMLERGMQKECKVMHKEHFRARGGYCG